MRTIIRTLGVVLAGSTLVAGAGVAVAEPQQGDQGYIGSIAWQPCPEVAATECGTLSLPIDWAEPGGEKFDLAVARRKATDPAKRVGAMLINPGGPGGSGVDFALGADSYFSQDVQARFDIIGFDPRGVARSQPVKCSTELLDKQPSLYPRDQAEFDQLAAYNRDLANDCRRNTGPMFDHADTLGVIQDMDALRHSLGESKINYYGVSYGTLIGQQYAERYGNRIRAMVIDSNMDHSLGAQSFVETEAESVEGLFTEFAKWSDRTPGSALHGKDVVKFWDDLLARADRGEIRDGDRVISAADISQRALGIFYGPAWSFLAEWLAALSESRPVPVPAAASTVVETGENPFPAVFCQDWQFRVKDHRELSGLIATANRVAPHMRGSALGHLAVTGCIGHPDKANNPQHRLDIKHAPKILMLNALHDPSTPYAWAVDANRQSRDTTVLVTYEGWGHGVYDRNSCTTSAMDGYLIDLNVPKQGMRCPAVEPPAAPVASAETGRLPVGPKPGLPGWQR